MSSTDTSAPIRRDQDLALLARIDGLICELAAELGAEQRQYPTLIARSALERAEYPHAFPHLLMLAAPLARPEREPATLLERDNLAGPWWCLSPPVCCRAYTELAGGPLAMPVVIPARGRCYRHEAEVRPGVRQIEFE